MKVPMGALFFRDYHNPPCFFGKVSIAIVKASFQTLKKARTNVKVSFHDKVYIEVISDDFVWRMKNCENS